MNNQLQISFNNQILSGFVENGTPYIPMLPIVEHLGLDWHNEIIKINGKFHADALIIASVTDDGKVCHFLCLPLYQLVSFLMCIDICYVKVEFIKALNDFQKQCANYLQAPSDPVSSATLSQLISPLLSSQSA